MQEKILWDYADLSHEAAQNGGPAAFKQKLRDDAVENFKREIKDDFYSDVCSILKLAVPIVVPCVINLIINGHIAANTSD